MNTQLSPSATPPALLRLDTGEQEDELEEAAREDKEDKEEGEPDIDLERQERLNSKNRPH